MVKAKHVTGSHPEELETRINAVLADIDAAGFVFGDVKYAMAANDVDGGCWEYGALITYDEAVDAVAEHEG
jgi:hypothetical protein